MSEMAFERYAPFIQEYIRYRTNWSELKEVQVEACEAIMDTENHVIIASGTASGKTEAAFFPILTLLERHPSNSVGIMYIGPLKALINDQFQRLNKLLENREIPVWPWHGDVSHSVKKKALKMSQGIVQITPESLEALIMRHPGDAYRLFSDLRFIVIDEIHALMGTDRGLQVLCQIARLEKLTGCTPRRIGLSATLNDYQSAKLFLSSGSHLNVETVGTKIQRRKISIGIQSFIIPKDDKKADEELSRYYSFLYDICHREKCIIFTNSRANSEEIIMNMKAIAKHRKEPDIFYVHHGSISASLRREAEYALKQHTGPTVTAATLTLELGIDIGDLDSTIQIGAPYTCSSFVQRMGRSGRHTGKSRMMFVNLHEAKETKSVSPFDMLPWDLLRSIAVVQLYSEEHWVEPFEKKKKPFSLLAHQTLSTLMARGELHATELARNVLSLPAFRDTILLDEYRDLLRYMLQKDYLERMENGGIIVGLKGEKFTNHYSFYAVFQDEQTYRVMSKEKEIGSLTYCPAPNEVFILAGRAWIVLAIDTPHKIIYVNQTRNSRIPSWTGGGGDVHEKVVQRMKRILHEDTVYSYLQPDSAKLLSEARVLAKTYGLLENTILPGGENTFYICPWTGTKELRTIGELFSFGLKNSFSIFSVAQSHYHLSMTSALDMQEIITGCGEIKIDHTDPGIVLSESQTPRIDKYDFMVPEHLLRKAFLYNQMDVPAAIRILRNLI